LPPGVSGLGWAMPGGTAGGKARAACETLPLWGVSIRRAVKYRPERKVRLGTRPEGTH